MDAIHAYPLIASFIDVVSNFVHVSSLRINDFELDHRPLDLHQLHFLIVLMVSICLNFEDSGF